MLEFFLMIIITGTGRSGSSLLAKLFKELGSPVSGGWSEKINAGLEDPDVVALNCKILAFSGVKRPEDRWDTALLSQEYALLSANEFSNEIKTIAEKKEIVKDPRFILTLPVWVMSGIRPDKVFFCSRNLDDVARSKMAYQNWEQKLTKKMWINHLQAQIRWFFRWVEAFNLPVFSVRYPDFFENLPEFFINELAILTKQPSEVVRKKIKTVFDPDLVHFSNENISDKNKRAK